MPGADEIRDRLARLEERQLFAVATQEKIVGDLNTIRDELKLLHDFISGAKGARWALLALAGAGGYAMSWVDGLMRTFKH